MVHRLRQHLHLPQGSYDWVLILGGINDIGHGTPPEAIMEGLSQMYRISAHHGARVLAMTCMETRSPLTSSLDTRRQQLNGMIRRFVLEHKEPGVPGSGSNDPASARDDKSAAVSSSSGADGGRSGPPAKVLDDSFFSEVSSTLQFPYVVLLDLEKRLPYHSMDEAERARYWDDGLHLTADGYDLMAQYVFDALYPQIASYAQ